MKHYKRIYKCIQRGTPHAIKYSLAVRRRCRIPPFDRIQKGWTTLQVGCSGRLCTLGRSQAIILSRLVGDSGHVYVFEAIPENGEAFSQYIERYGINNIIMLRYGLWNSCGRIDFDVPENDSQLITTGSRAVDVRKDEPKRFDGERSLPVETIDSTVRRLNIKHVELINITTNGSEPEIIEGGEKTIRTNRPLICVPGENPNIRKKLLTVFERLEYRVHETSVKLHMLGRPFKELWAEPM